MKFAVPFSDIVEIIMIADKPLSAGEIRDAFQREGHLDHPITDEEWRDIANHIQMNIDGGDSSPRILIDGKKRGRKYYLPGMTWTTSEDLAEQAYSALCESPTELRWKEIEAITECTEEESANIQRLLKINHSDVGKGSKRGLWAVHGVHEIVESLPTRKFCWHCGVKL